MIGYFPEPYPDEIFYSICARFNDRMNFNNVAALKRNLFGIEKLGFSAHQPYRLSYFVQQLPPNHHYTTEKIIFNHTTFPYYQPFTPIEKVNQLYQILTGDRWQNMSVMWGGAAATNTSIPDYLQYCAECVEEDKKEFGEPYWHRVHQLAGVVVCHKHKAPLMESNIPSKRGRATSDIVSVSRFIKANTGIIKEFSPEYTDLLWEISRDTLWLLNQRDLYFDNQNMAEKYKNLLWQNGFSSYLGITYTEKLVQQVKEKFSDDLLRVIGCTIDENKRNWISYTLEHVRRNMHKQPLHHILLLKFFNNPISDFLNGTSKRSPFGIGPWSCLNPSCNKYLSPVIKLCQIKGDEHDKTLPIGEFKCDFCGFTYIRRGQDTSEQDTLRIDKVTDYGNVWDTKLTNLWNNPSISKRDIQRILKISRFDMEKEVSRLGLSLVRPQTIDKRLIQLVQEYCPEDLDLTDNYIEACRLAWLAILEQHSDLSIRSFRRTRYDALRKLLEILDPQWIAKHPFTHQEAICPQSEDDWYKLDTQLAKRVSEIAGQLKLRKKLLVHAKRETIITRSGYGDILRTSQQHLPLTYTTLDTVAESTNAFVIRKLRLTAEEYQTEGIKLSKTKLLILAGVKLKLINNTEVQEALQVMIGG